MVLLYIYNFHVVVLFLNTASSCELLFKKFVNIYDIRKENLYSFYDYYIDFRMFFNFRDYMNFIFHLYNHQP